MQITVDGLRLLNDGRVFYTCEASEDLDKALDILAKLRLDVQEHDPADDGPEVELIRAEIINRILENAEERQR